MIWHGSCLLLSTIWVNTHTHKQTQQMVTAPSSEPKTVPMDVCARGRRSASFSKWSSQSECTSIQGCLLVCESVSLPSLYECECLVCVSSRRLFISPRHTWRVRVLSSYRWLAWRSRPFPPLSRRRSETKQLQAWCLFVVRILPILWHSCEIIINVLLRSSFLNDGIQTFAVSCKCVSGVVYTLWTTKVILDFCCTWICLKWAMKPHACGKKKCHCSSVFFLALWKFTKAGLQ